MWGYFPPELILALEIITGEKPFGTQKSWNWATLEFKNLNLRKLVQESGLESIPGMCERS
jgi:hypothetical protein